MEMEALTDGFFVWYKKVIVGFSDEMININSFYFLGLN